MHCLSLIEPKVTFVSERYADHLKALDCNAGKIVAFGPAYESLLADARDGDPPEVAHSEDGMVILYTSGTTGLPKGAVISQRAMFLDAHFLEHHSLFRWLPIDIARSD